VKTSSETWIRVGTKWRKARPCPATATCRGKHRCQRPKGHDGPHHARWAMTFGETYWRDPQPTSAETKS
jgi:hypothetical protein